MIGLALCGQPTEGEPRQWQTYAITFHAPAQLADGTVQPGSFTVLHNGVLVQD